ncbi:MAG: TSCPD domain-containing protein, partial [Erysipelotrichaceae bacterium]
METFEYRPINVCSTKMIFKLENNIIKEVQVIGGCAGNSLGLCRLLKDQPIETIIAKLKGTRCRT